VPGAGDRARRPSGAAAKAESLITPPARACAKAPSSAGGGDRTHTSLPGPGILSPVRLPVPPPRRVPSFSHELHRFALPADFPRLAVHHALPLLRNPFPCDRNRPSGRRGEALKHSEAVAAKHTCPFAAHARLDASHGSPSEVRECSEPCQDSVELALHSFHTQRHARCCLASATLPRERPCVYASSGNPWVRSTA
jgi:hypothetical protein